MNEIVSLKNVWVEFDGKIILENHNLSFKSEDFIGIIGPNGGGKTTLLKVILGLIKPSRGEVKVFGKTPPISHCPIGYVPQINSFDSEFPISVQEVVLMGRLFQKKLFSKYNKNDCAEAEKALKKVEMLDKRNQQMGCLSGGERQRVFIARALVCHPKLLLLDEPTASVDPKMTTGIYELLGNLKKDMAIILVTHDIGVISSHVDKIACLNCQIHYHDNKEITSEALEQVYHCPVDLIAHGVPHRILHDHKNGDCSHD